ncbi:MAG: GH116 family glycosyl-hydrolase [Bryobacteraceae bacterium]
MAWKTDRRGFLAGLGVAGGLPALAQDPSPTKPAEPAAAQPPSPERRHITEYPRTFTGRELQNVAFPLGGIGTGSISLGGRGNLRDWEIFNRPDKGRSPDYAFASVWVRNGKGETDARVLESRLAPPYQATRGLGPENVPGLKRLEKAQFKGEFPLAHIDFSDSKLAVKLSLDAFSPFIPLEADDSGLPVAILRYTAANPGTSKVSVSIGLAVDNPIGAGQRNVTRTASGETRVNDYRTAGPLHGLFLHNPSLASGDPMKGSIVLAALKPEQGKLTWLRGWPEAKWWASPLLYWDDFSKDGSLGPEAEERKPVASLCLQQEIGPKSSAEYTFLLAWHFPNRTAQWCGWAAPKGHEQDNLGNYYCTRFTDAWEAANHAAGQLERLERGTRTFARLIRETTLPAAVKDAAASNLSTLVTQTSFRTADGEFHGFEGCDDHSGCCFGNCTHVWNYETATQFLFPTLARSLRKSAFGYSEDDSGAMRHRQMLPDGIERFGYAAADGQMGQIIKVYLDWKLTGDTEWLRRMWPRVKKGIEFAWSPGSWDANRDGVMEGVQHNTYDVEFYGPNPHCGIWYLGALRAAEEIAKAMGEGETARSFHQVFESGSRWLDQNLFNGQYYFQQVRTIPRDQIAPVVVSDMGSESTVKPEFQLGDGCLVDQMAGQYLAELAGLGDLLDPAHIRKTLESIYRYNYKRRLYDHDSVQRVFALNDESALVICDYGAGKRPEIPFPYFAEVMTGFEYQAAVHMLMAGMVPQGIECIENIRLRYDGERRNPWDEAECGHHYARAMASWSALVALTGFESDSTLGRVRIDPRYGKGRFIGFWSNGMGWGSVAREGEKGIVKYTLTAEHGKLPVKIVAVPHRQGARVSARLGSSAVPAKTARSGSHLEVQFANEIQVIPGTPLVVSV